MKRKLKIILCVMMSVLFIASNNIFCAYGAYKLPFELSCKGCYLYNVDTQTVVYEKNKDLKLEPASLVKIMTAAVVLDKVKDIDSITATAKGYIFDELYGQNGTVAGIVKGETLTIRQLLQCMLSQSACEAAMILADAVSPDNIDGFVEMMNSKAKALGARNTHFVNPHGLHAQGQYTTAYDMFLITKYAMDLPAFMDIVSATSHEIPATNKREAFSVFSTIDPMKKSSKYYYAPIKGIKTGTEESGRSFVSSASKDGFTYICCVLSSPYKDEKTNKIIPGNKAFEDSVNIYKWAFENLKIKTIVSEDTPITEVKLKYVFNKDHLKVASEKNASALVLKQTDVSKIKTIYNLPDEIMAPIKKGEILGTAKLEFNGSIISEFNLVSYETVERNWLLYSLDFAKKLLDFVVIKIITIVVAVFLLIVALISIGNKRNNKKSSIKNRNLKTKNNKRKY